jgi:hypothetical protein
MSAECPICGKHDCSGYPADFPIHADYPFLPDDDPQKHLLDPPKPVPEPRGRRTGDRQ